MNEAEGLRRGLNLWDTTLLVLGLVLGGGIFLTPAAVARSVPSASGILVLWILGGVFTLAGGLVYAELGAMMPRAGGMYVYIREAYGAMPAFLYAWIAYFVILAGANAAVAVGFAEYLSVFFPGLGTREILFAAGGYSISAGQIVAVGATLLLSATHYVGVREGSRIQGFFTSLIVLALLGLAVGGLFTPSPEAGRGAAAAAPPPAGAPALGAAMVAVLWTYYGWNEIVAVAGEVREPRRNLPLAILLGTGLVTLLYVAVNVVFLKAMSVAELAGSARPAEVASSRLFGPSVTWAIALAVTAAAFGCASAGLVPGPRITYALARDGLFASSFGRAHPRFHTPSFGITVQAVWTSLLCLSGRYDQLYTYATFAVILAYAATGVSIFVFRRTLPNLARPYRCWGYPVVPLLFIASSVLVAANTLRTQPRETLAGIVILLMGLVVFYALRRRGRREP